MTGGALWPRSTVQLNVRTAVKAPSVTLTVTSCGTSEAALAETTPVMALVLPSMESPPGRPAAAYVTDAPVVEYPETGSETASPAALSWSPGLPKCKGETNQEKLRLADEEPSATDTVTA